MFQLDLMLLKATLQVMEDSIDGAASLLVDEDDVENHFKVDLDDTGSMTSQDDGCHDGGANTEQSGYHSEEEGSDVEGRDGDRKFYVLMKIGLFTGLELNKFLVRNQSSAQELLTRH